MKPPPQPVVAWSRDDLVRAIIMMIKVAGYAFALIWLVYIVRFFVIPHYRTESIQQIESAKAAWGQLGDFIGGTLNPVISLLTLTGLFFTVLLQHESMIRIQEDSTRSHQALETQTKLALEAARLQSLLAVLEVTTELHRQAVANNDIASSIHLLKRKEQIAGQIIQINDDLNA